ncbi:hypothetical protein [Nostoc sp. C117]|uniref:hypothetical protein n=1 Tax=Nostoc sp. C117 TaxID=3349875 RepID=UPI00370D2DBF
MLYAKKNNLELALQSVEVRIRQLIIDSIRFSTVYLSFSSTGLGLADRERSHQAHCLHAIATGIFLSRRGRGTGVWGKVKTSPLVARNNPNFMSQVKTSPLVARQSSSLCPLPFNLFSFIVECVQLQTCADASKDRLARSR